MSGIRNIRNKPLLHDGAQGGDGGSSATRQPHAAAAAAAAASFPPPSNRQGFSKGSAHEDSSSEYTDSPEFQNEPKRSAVFSGLFSGFTEKSAPPFSAFNTPYINTGINKEYSHSRFGIQNNLENDRFAEKGVYDAFDNYHDQYPSWAPHENLPITRQEIQATFIQLTDVFGFQEDSMKNMYDYFMKLLDSRASRMGAEKSLKSLHADYIGGVNANFKKWYFASQLDVDDTIGFANAKTNGQPKTQFLKKNKLLKEDILSLEESEKRWLENMNCLSALDCVVQIALYLLIWAEANNIRFMPECICFIFKCCNDYFYSINFNEPISRATEKAFLDHAITPLFQFYYSQSFKSLDSAIRRDKDHSSVIGYDDINQLFWYRKGLERLVLSDKTKLMDLNSNERYQAFCDVTWNKAFYKTYRETRTWLHLLTNFNRIWIIHLSVFWVYTALNSPTFYTRNYRPSVDTQPTPQARLSAMALSGAVSTFLEILALSCQYAFVPRKWPGAEHLFGRLTILILLLITVLLPSIYIFVLQPLNKISKSDEYLAWGQFLFSISLTAYFAVVPLDSLFTARKFKNDRNFLAKQYFTSSVYKLHGKNALASFGLWVIVFSCKFVESYFFVTLSLSAPTRELSSMRITRCVGESLLGSALCIRENHFLLFFMIITDMVMFFLDTYLWYIVWNTVFSLFYSLHIGISIWTPWRNIFSRLPKRIYSKIIAVNAEKQVRKKFLVAHIWNSLLVSMYREHLLSIEILEKLVYRKELTVDAKEESQESNLKEPTFFLSQEDAFMKSSSFEAQSEAQRRITFFAQSLSTPMLEPLPIESVPSFSVLIPHYKEKVILSLKEIIKEEDHYSHITLLEYLKQLHPVEWQNFVQDTKALVQEGEAIDSNNATLYSTPREKYDDLAYYCVGFKSSGPEFILRTRIWASLRTQTLYRTICGFMNYHRAIKLLYETENMNLGDTDEDEAHKIEQAAMLALRKTRIIVSMQRLQKAGPQELEDVEFILRAFPEVQIAYLEEGTNPLTNELTYYSCLMDGSCEILENGTRCPKYRIRLSGNPNLGDGKSDNQNTALCFIRGEYLQLVDANQDNYLEECLKIRSVLAEFEEIKPLNNPYSMADKAQTSPIAIIGTREYIFSENIGLLGDVAAAKEQTFGTLFARTLAQIGGKLHYGHPDFLNTLFMTTRGGVSKAQKGLHLNEDVYAGMNALLRGGRIKHCEYMQCGKGRDLGFGSILNFTTKIGSGMGEQILSREYFYIGTQLPIDRFLSIYYAHAGFHLNNVLIFLSIKLFILVCLHMTVLSSNSVICEYDKNRPITDPKRPNGCHNLMPVIQWLQNYIISISMVFGISFVPLFIQELAEKGIVRALTRLAKHFASVSPFFEVFVCKIYAQSMISDMKFGGARYIATGRGFATTRVAFIRLYSRFATESLYFGGTSVCLLLYISINMWNLPLMYLWYVVLALCLSPFLFNPNQFLWGEFFLDYGKFIKWLLSNSDDESWSSFIREARAQITGTKLRRRHGGQLSSVIRQPKKPSILNLIFFDILPQLAWTVALSIAYLYANSQSDSLSSNQSGNTVQRLLICAFGPIIVNAAILLVFFIISVVAGPVLTVIFKSFPAVCSATCHALGVLNHVIFFEVLLISQNFNYSLTLLGLCNTILIQSFTFKVATELFVSREIDYSTSNRAWWSGNWLTAGLGWHIMSQPFREYICKIMEMSAFTVDYIWGHLLLFVQFPLTLIPYIDRWHSLVLLWLIPGRQFRPRILSKKERRRRKTLIYFNFTVFIVSAIMITSVIILPFAIHDVLQFDVQSILPEWADFFVQPAEQYNPRKGLANYKPPNYNRLNRAQ